jgi:hypothetical protein
VNYFRYCRVNAENLAKGAGEMKSTQSRVGKRKAAATEAAAAAVAAKATAKATAKAAAKADATAKKSKHGYNN